MKTNKRWLSRRELNTQFAAFSLSLPAATCALATTVRAKVDSTVRQVKFPDGTTIPALGQGSWHLGQGRHPADVEEEALRTGLSLGMTLIDTSGNYGDGQSEKLISHVIAGWRDRVFLVSKVEADQVTGDEMARACEASLARLGTNYLDLYLLHWPVSDSQKGDTHDGAGHRRSRLYRQPYGNSRLANNTSTTSAVLRRSYGGFIATELRYIGAYQEPDNA